MRVSHRYRFVFFAFPKTGSESVRKALEPFTDFTGQQAQEIQRGPGGRYIIPDHATPLEMREVFQECGWPFETYFRFTFVRNPWSRLVSVYRMIGAMDPGFDMAFDKWLLQTRTDGPGASGEGRRARRAFRFGTYTLDKFVCDENGVRLVDHVFRMEDMAEVPTALRRRGIPLDFEFMPAVNRSKPVDLNAYYTTPVLKAVVAARYAKDIAEFGYSYPG